MVFFRRFIPGVILLFGVSISSYAQKPQLGFQLGPELNVKMNRNFGFGNDGGRRNLQLGYTAGATISFQSTSNFGTRIGITYARRAYTPSLFSFIRPLPAPGPGPFPVFAPPSKIVYHQMAIPFLFKFKRRESVTSFFFGISLNYDWGWKSQVFDGDGRVISSEFIPNTYLTASQIYGVEIVLPYDGPVTYSLEPYTIWEIRDLGSAGDAVLSFGLRLVGTLNPE